MAIEMSRLTKEYVTGEEKTTVFSDVSLSLKAATMTALMGPSGSGKSTLLNLLAGLDAPTKGSLTIFGAHLAGMSEAELTRWRRENLGYLYQDAALIDTLTCSENIELPMLLASLGGKERRHRVDALLEVVGLAGYDARRPSELSRGQQQRVSLARALSRQPKLLLCDEPTGNLDRSTADSIMLILRRLTDSFGTTAVVATHDQRVADIADQVLLIEHASIGAVH